MTAPAALVTIDPGTDACGCAYWFEGRLLRAGLVKGIAGPASPRAREQMARAVGAWISKPWVHPNFETVIELPQTYGGRAAKGDTNDLISLGATVGALEAALRSYGAVTNVHPSEWKGGIPKPKKASDPEYVIIGKCRRSLEIDEWAKIEIPGNVRLSWDVFDAVGIGLAHLHRGAFR